MTPSPVPSEAIGNPDWSDNWTIGRGGLRMEIIDATTRDVWLCHEVVTTERARSLPLPEGFAVSGVAEAVADLAYFRRSPEATVDGPVDTMVVDGLLFARVARPIGREPEHVDLNVLSIDKHHTMLYVAGRTIDVLDFGDGTVATPAFAPPARAADATGPSRPLPDRWRFRSVTLEHDLTAVVPNPARVVFFPDGSGFHGPVSIDIP